LALQLYSEDLHTCSVKAFLIIQWIKGHKIEFSWKYDSLASCPGQMHFEFKKVT